VFWGIDTRATFIGHCPALRAAIDRVSALKFGVDDPDPPASLEYLFKRRMIEALIDKVDVQGEDVRYLEMVYAAVDDEVLKYAIASGHVKQLQINGRGYYLANGVDDARHCKEKLQRRDSGSDHSNQRGARSRTLRERSS
jgi:hypothetical protein